MSFSDLLRRLGRSPSLAATLSFFVPGLGQAAAGFGRRAVVVFMPALALGAFLLVMGVRGLVNKATNDTFLLAVLIVDILLLGYRVWAIADAYYLAGRPAGGGSGGGSGSGARRAGTAFQAGSIVLAVLVVVTIAMHGFIASVDIDARSALANMSNKQGPDWIATVPPDFTMPPDPEDETPTPGASEEPTTEPTDEPSPDDTPSPDQTFATPSKTPVGGFDQNYETGVNWDADNMLNLLLIGADAGVGGSRMTGLRPDTMILLQVDMTDGRAAMYGIPRNLKNVPLEPQSGKYYANGRYPDMLNWLWLEAVQHPKNFPYFQDNQFMRGITALEHAVTSLTGARVDGTAIINLPGFIYVVDALGGIDINVPRRLYDTNYGNPDHPGKTTVDIKAGQQHMDGHTALAYARSRYSTDDYDRMRRQQLVLRAIRQQVNPCALLPHVNDLLTALGKSFWTDMPIDDVPRLVGLAQYITTSNVKSFSFAPASIGASNNLLTTKGINNIRSMVSHGLDGVPPASNGGAGGGGGFHC